MICDGNKDCGDEGEDESTEKYGFTKSMLFYVLRFREFIKEMIEFMIGLC